MHVYLSTSVITSHRQHRLSLHLDLMTSHPQRVYGRRQKM